MVSDVAELLREEVIIYFNLASYMEEKKPLICVITIRA